jgi:PAS domain-containing protein
MFALKNNKNIPTPFLRVVDHKVAEVNNGFVKLSGFSKNELLGKSIKEIKKILRIDSQAIEMEGIENISIFTKKYKSVYIFTKKYDPIEVKITLMDLKENGKIYYFTTTESTMLEEFIPYASSIINTNLIGCAVYTIDGLMLKANNSYFDFLGISQDKIGDCIGKNITDIVKINNLSGIEDIFIKIRNTLSSYCSNEFKCDYLNGKSKYFVVTYNLIYIKGKTKMIVSESFDVTEKVESRIELQNQKKKLNAIIDNISDSIVVFGKDSNELLLNYNAKKEFCNPSSKEELLEILNGMTCFDIDGKLIKFQKYIIDKVLGGEVLKDALVSFPMTGGCKYIRISGTPMYDTFGEIYMVALRFRDATDYVKRDSLIEKQRDQLEAIVENISDNIVIIDKNGTYIMFNKAAENNPLYNFDYLINIKDRYLQVEHYDMNGKLLDFEDIPSSRVLRGEKFIDNKVKVKNEKCQACYDVSGIPLFDECGRFNMGIMVLHDITDKLKNQENIYIKTQYEAINKIIYNLEMGFTRISFPDFKIIDINNKSYNFLRKFGRNVGSFDSILGDCIFDFYNDNELMRVCLLMKKYLIIT